MIREAKIKKTTGVILLLILMGVLSGCGSIGSTGVDKNMETTPCALKVEMRKEFYKKSKISNISGYEDEMILDLKVPRVKKTIPGAKEMNKAIRADFTGVRLEEISKLEKGDFSIVETQYVTKWFLDYEIKQYKKTRLYALVLEEIWGFSEAGETSDGFVWYYDGEAGTMISPEEYLKVIGVEESFLIEEYNKNEMVEPVDALEELRFYYDEKGELKFIEIYSM